MRCRIVLSKRARRQILKLPAGVDRRVEDAIDDLAQDPRPQGVKKLKAGDELYRLRVGSYRILYHIEDKRLVVLVVKAVDRRDVYRGG